MALRIVVPTKTRGSVIFVKIGALKTVPHLRV